MIRFEQVVKEYSGPLARLRGGPVRALDGVTLDVAPGSALGIVGPNGAGKSTLIRLLLGYIRPTRGAVEVGGRSPRGYVERHGIAYVSELVAIPPTWTVRGALEMYAALSEVDETRARIAEVMERMGIAEVAGRRVANLSKGNLQRLAVAQAILAPRRVMVLDEPTTGLDPEWIARLRDVVAEWRAADPERIVVIASHNLDELERTVDRVAVLGGGRVREIVELAGEAANPPYLLEVEASRGVGALVAAAFPGAVPEDGTPNAFRVAWMEPRELSSRLATLLERGVVVRSVAPRRVSLAERVWGGGAR
ncbi:MAG TPA: ABC transporter ATP-binding protein [Longimicrobium sp.]|nr:ABC transporter ATP-binding protein [Longimicrobium sp.]